MTLINFLFASLISAVFFQISCESMRQGEKESDPLKLETPSDLDWDDLQGSRARTLQMRQGLLSIARERQIEKPVFYANGVLGMKGRARVFSSTWERLSDMDHVYWAAVKVLSEKFSCFMQEKYRRDDEVVFKCKDNRLIHFEFDRDYYGMSFEARQFDAIGREIAVRKRKIYPVLSGKRLSDEFSAVLN